MQSVLLIIHSSPFQKVRDLRRVGGFGEGNATGLVMIFHPNEFSIINPVTRNACQQFGVSLGGEARVKKTIN